MNDKELLAKLPIGRMEFHRNAVALLPLPDDFDPGSAIMVFHGGKKKQGLSCNCLAYKKKSSCGHIKQLGKAFRHLTAEPEKGCFEPLPLNGSWYRLASTLQDTCPVDPQKLIVETEQLDGGKTKEILISRSEEEPLLKFIPRRDMFHDIGIDEVELFNQRTGLVASNESPFHRGRILDMLSVMTMNDTERVLNYRGMKSRRQALEESFWFRMAYHFKTIHGTNEVSMSAEIDEATGRFMIRFSGIEVFIAPAQALRVRNALLKDFENHSDLKIWPESLESIVKVTADEKNNLKLTLFLLLYLPDGSTRIFEKQRLKKFWYKNSVYIPEKKIFATWRKPDRFQEMFGDKYTKKIRQNRLPELIDKIEDIFSPPNIVDQSVSRLQIHREPTHLEIESAPIGSGEHDWCWLHFRYGFSENISVSLKDIYNARNEGKRFFPVNGGWVDVEAVNLENLCSSIGGDIRTQLASSEKKLKLNRIELLRLQAMFDKPIKINAPTKPESLLIRSIMEMRPTEPATGYENLTTSLRRYQQNGVDWLAFLYQNRFGGLLCDEMGLGKTHQVMALMVWLFRVKKQHSPFLVVCPTTVISHWLRKICEHASTLVPMLYHGTDRDLENMKTPGTVLITSYGILLRDIDQLEKMHFSVAVFDEAQCIKNPETKSYSAANVLKADMKIGVTGTPIENRLADLKALMDLAVPGYLGSDHQFQQRYEWGAKHRRKQLRKLISPFVLRRTKSAVLDELPEKIEDIRYCRLTETQVKLYREAVSGHGRGLIRQLQYENADIPYIHIFALLTLLKQICNHPASVCRDRGIHADNLILDSGKWDLFTELVNTCLENDRKIVVFSQFVAMIDMIVKHLENQKISTAVITGKTRKRSEQIDKFNNDPDCKVFVGSLKAGGSGIDLTGGSVVIHYDRWWNAAREDQATDRVHRIGQTRGVQVFKLVTEGTLEEKISAIIDRKKKLMSDVIFEDDPGLLNSFTRQELIELLTVPV
ncbi:MAG: DEAD/DEAH box helicase [Desulfobacterales bacterium]